MFVEDFLAAFVLLTVSKYYCLLYFSAILVFIIGFWILFKCDQLFRLNITADGDENGSSSTSIQSLALVGGLKSLQETPSDEFVPGSPVAPQLTSLDYGIAVHKEALANTGSDADLISNKCGKNKWKKAMEAWKNKKRYEVSGTVRQRPPPLNVMFKNICFLNGEFLKVYFILRKFMTANFLRR